MSLSDIDKEDDLKKIEELLRHHVKAITLIINPKRYTDVKEFVSLSFMPYVAAVCVLIKSICTVTNATDDLLIDIFTNQIKQALIKDKEENNG